MEPVIWLKAKYAANKTKGRYKGGEHGAPKRKHKKMPNKQKPTQQRVMLINAMGKTTWIWRAI